MVATILLTSFTTWEKHHITNAADDLLLEVLKADPPPSFHFLRLLPVDFDLAPQLAIAKFNELQPDAVILCGMAENRRRLSVESRAIQGDLICKTSLDLNQLTAGLSFTEISHDAGQFVCNRLYFEMLRHLQEQAIACPCLFVHVPLLTPENLNWVLSDFQLLLNRII